MGMKCVSVQRAGRGKMKHNDTQQPCNKYPLDKITKKKQATQSHATTLETRTSEGELEKERAKV